MDTNNAKIDTLTPNEVLKFRKESLQSNRDKLLVSQGIYLK